MENSVNLENPIQPKMIDIVVYLKPGLLSSAI